MRSAGTSTSSSSPSRAASRWRSARRPPDPAAAHDRPQRVAAEPRTGDHRRPGRRPPDRREPRRRRALERRARPCRSCPSTRCRSCSSSPRPRCRPALTTFTQPLVAAPTLPPGGWVQLGGARRVTYELTAITLSGASPLFTAGRSPPRRPGGRTRRRPTPAGTAAVDLALLLQRAADGRPRAGALDRPVA